MKLDNFPPKTSNLTGTLENCAGMVNVAPSTFKVVEEPALAGMDAVASTVGNPCMEKSGTEAAKAVTVPPATKTAPPTTTALITCFIFQSPLFHWVSSTYTTGEENWFYKIHILFTLFQ